VVVRNITVAMIIMVPISICSLNIVYVLLLLSDNRVNRESIRGSKGGPGGGSSSLIDRYNDNYELHQHAYRNCMA